MILLSQLSFNGAVRVSIDTRDSLLLEKGTYASILFQADGAGNTGIPSQFTFTTSGHPPPGMIFESYPCHKPGLQNCPALASADGIYLDGIPNGPGSYRVRIAAKDSKGNAGAKDFTVTVKP